jgi:cytochrome c553
LFGFQFPVVSCGATYAPKKIWGSARVEADGSASFRVPANVPLYFMALDAEGRALQRMRSFTHLTPGEVQTCIGCHEERLTTPAPAAHPLAMQRAPQDLTPPEWGVGGFSYAQVVQPVLDRHCVACHNARQHPRGVDLAGDLTDIFSVSYDVLARRGTPAEDPHRGGASMAQFHTQLVSWIPTYNGTESNILDIRPRAWGSPASPLAELLRSGHPDAAGRPRVQLTDAERRRLFAWMDCNVPYYPTSASHDITLPGCRRLYPAQLDATLAGVAARRCATCHTGGKIPRQFFVRITNPQDNAFLLAPLAKNAGGTEACGRPVFASTNDPDYQALLQTFADIPQRLRDRPRLDSLAATAP